MSSDDGEIQRSLGHIEGKIDSLIEDQKTHKEEMKEVSRHVTALEIKAAKSGALSGAFSGGIIAVGISLITAEIKSKMGL